VTLRSGDISNQMLKKKNRTTIWTSAKSPLRGRQFMSDLSKVTATNQILKLNGLARDFNPKLLYQKAKRWINKRGKPYDLPLFNLRFNFFKQILESLLNSTIRFRKEPAVLRVPASFFLAQKCYSIPLLAEKSQMQTIIKSTNSGYPHGHAIIQCTAAMAFTGSNLPSGFRLYTSQFA